MMLQCMIILALGLIMCPKLYVSYNCKLAVPQEGTKYAESPRNKLFASLCGKGNSYVIPTTPVKYTAVLRPMRIVSANLRSESLSLVSVYQESWMDPGVAWNPKDFGGISYIALPAAMVWTPDMQCYNWAAGNIGFQESMVEVYANGLVVSVRPMLSVVLCAYKVLYFPFDHQKCQLVLGPWNYIDSQMQIQNTSGISLSIYETNNEWRLKAIYTYGLANSYIFGDLTFTYHSLEFNLEMFRFPLYYVYAIILPCVMLSSLTLLSFWIPCDTGEKLQLGMSVVMAYSIFMLLIAETMPTNSGDVPLLGIYLTISMVVTSISVLMETYTAFLFHQHNFAKSCPARLQNFTHWIDEAFFGIHRVRFGLRIALGKGIKDVEPAALESNNQGNEEEKADPDQPQQGQSDKIFSKGWAKKKYFIPKMMKKPRNILTMKEKIDNPEDLRRLAGREAEEWKLIADIMDRFFFYIYTVFLLSITSVLFIIMPLFISTDNRTDLKQSPNTTETKGWKMSTVNL